VKLKVNVARRGAGFVALGGARLLDEVERSGTRRLQMARAWPRAAQHKLVADFNRVTVFLYCFLQLLIDICKFYLTFEN